MTSPKTMWSFELSERNSLLSTRPSEANAGHEPHHSVARAHLRVSKDKRAKKRKQEKQIREENREQSEKPEQSHRRAEGHESD